MQKFTKEHTCSITSQLVAFALYSFCSSPSDLALPSSPSLHIETGLPTRRRNKNLLPFALYWNKGRFIPFPGDCEAAGGKGCTGSVSSCFVVVVNPSSSEHGCFLFVVALVFAPRDWAGDEPHNISLSLFQFQAIATHQYLKTSESMQFVIAR